MPARVAIAAIDSQESALLRLLLENVGVEVRLRPIARPRDLVAALNEPREVAEHLIVCCHADERGIVLNELHPSAEVGEPFLDRAGPADIRAQARLDGRVVICTGCGTGSSALAAAFLAAGASAYIAPDGDPSDAIFFLTHLYYGLRWGRTLPQAFDLAQTHSDEDSTLFRLYV